MFFKDFSRTRTKIILLILGVAAASSLSMTVFQWVKTEADGTDSEYEGLDDGFVDIYAVLSDGQKLCLYEKNDNVYFFLPSYAEKAVLEIDSKHTLLIQGQEVKSGIDILPGEYAVKIDGNDYMLSCLKSADMPTVYIETGDGNMKRIDEDKTLTDKGHITVISAGGNEDLSQPVEMIKARGNSSFEAEKKSYRVKLGEKAALLGLDSDKSFIFQANAYDHTNLRNMLAFTLANRLGIKYVSDFRMADVYLNGCYRGNYIVLEPVKVGKGHVDIEGPSDAFLLETVHREDRIDEGAKAFLCGSRFFLELLYPEAANTEQFEYVSQHMNRLQGEVENIGAEDSLENIENYIDMPSVAKMYLMDFLTNDIDCGSYSSFAYIDGNDSMVHLGPVWDYDKAWGNDIKKNGRSDFNAYEISWPMMLARNEQFKNIIEDELMDAEEGILKLYNDDIYAFDEQLGASLYMDNIRNELPNGQCVDTGSHEGDIEQLRAYMLDRYELLQDILEKEEDYCRVYVKDDKAQFFWLKKGTTLGQERLDFLIRLYRYSGFCMQSGEAVTEDTVFSEDTIIYEQ